MGMLDSLTPLIYPSKSDVGLLESARGALALSLIFSTFIVFIGVYLENERFSKYVQHTGWSLLLVGLAAEVLISAELWGVDTGITRLQQDKIFSLEKEAEVLRGQNLELEKAVSPRRIKQLAAAEILSRFAGVPFVVISPSDFEPKRTAGYIQFVLLQAKWVQFTEQLNMSQFSFFDGIIVHIMGNVANSDDPAQRAAATLVSVLKDNEIVAREGFPLLRVDEQGKPLMPKFPLSLDPPNVIVVEVGPKPLPQSLETAPPTGKGLELWDNTAE